MKKIILFIVLVAGLVIHTFPQIPDNFIETISHVNVNKVHAIVKNTQDNKWVGISKYLQSSSLQIPDDMNGRLYYLCKVWGYFKYFNQSKCLIKWDTLLNATIKQVLLSTNNVDFNNNLMDMFNKVGNNSYMANPGLQPDTNFNFNDSWITDTIFSQTVRNFLDTFSLYIYPDTSTCFVKKNNYSNTNYRSYIDFRNDLISMSLNYTSEADRLTTMFYYWNVINYFFPYKNLMDQPWDNTLFQFIPLIRQATTDNNFHKTFLKLVTKINDSHGFTSSTILTNSFWGGSYLPQIYFTRIDTNCVVTKVREMIGVNVGDILTAINGIGIHNIEDSLSDFIPASTSAALYRDIYYNMLFGGSSTNINCTFLDSTNNLYNVSIARTMSSNGWRNWILDNGNIDSYFITNCGYGYVDMGKLQRSEVNNMYVALKNTPAIIFDIRNYPNGTLWDLAPLFFPAPIISAKWFSPALAYFPYRYYFPGWYYCSNDGQNMGNWSNADSYNGNIYILVNQETLSQAEYTCQYLSYHPNAKVIGTQTTGADGNVSYVTLPGGIYTYFTSLGWYYADGYQQQRNGVKIDSIVTPTPTGLRHGRDEILEAVFNCPLAINNVNIAKKEVSIYPNPATDFLFIEGIELKKLDFSILNIVGQSVKTGKLENNTSSRINIANLNSGIYFIQLKTEDNTKTIKFIKR